MNYLKPEQKNSSRRKFVKNLSLGFGASSLAFALPQLGFGYSKKLDKKMGVALVGLGYYSTDLLAPALQETENCYLAGIVTGTPSKAKKWQEQYNIPEKNIYNYENFEEIKKNKDIDIVYIVLPNSMHAEYTIKAANAGKHVICEKPMALNEEECKQMIKACNDNNVKLSIGYRMQFEPTTQEVMRLGQEKVMGAVKLVTASAGYRESRPEHWKVKRTYGGGPMMDMGVYSLQAARYITGEEPNSVTAQSFNTNPDIFKEVPETIAFQVQFPSGAIGNLSTSFGMSVNSMHTTTEKGWFKLDPFSAYRGIKGASKEGVFEFPVINQQAAQMDEVSVCISEDKPMRVPGEEGLKDIIVVQAIEEALKTGKKVEIKR
ncbi:Gfo/Idh/MocA family protein [Flexithrix dorotheae]|uniref:Gfo/Idh/MocA family protein n=1 Tax=Flexithrix dorotheae TaxID=70993 RepID=UPI00037BD9CE|nr:Gfo/Idh/MocA family oxidoreductase [Flexithrix dorotheae]